MTKKTNTANTTTNSNGINTDAANTTNAAAEAQGNHANSDFAQALERDARQFADRNKDAQGRAAKPMHVVVADFEYLYNQASHYIYRVSEGTAARPDIRWPFHRIAAASWLVLKFEPGADVPVVEELVSVTNYHADEQTIVERFFRTLEHYSDATLITWGGELKDLAVLRRCAGEFGLVLPQQLRDLNPWAQTRLDLAIAVTGRANPVHLPEYCFATCLPCKPSPSKSIGELVQQAKWTAVSEQCMADVLSTTVIALRHMFSHGMITCHLPRSYDAIAKAAVKDGSASAFVRNSFAPWAFGQVAASRLKGWSTGLPERRPPPPSLMTPHQTAALLFRGAACLLLQHKESQPHEAQPLSRHFYIPREPPRDCRRPVFSSYAAMGVWSGMA